MLRGAIVFIILMTLLIPHPIYPSSSPEIVMKAPKVIYRTLESIRDGITFKISTASPAAASLRIYTLSGYLVGSASAYINPGSIVKLTAKASDGDGDHIVVLTIRDPETKAYLRMKAKFDLAGIIDPPDYPPLVELTRFDVGISGDSLVIPSFGLSSVTDGYPDYPATYVERLDDSIIAAGTLSNSYSSIPSKLVPLPSGGSHTLYLRIEDSDSSHYWVEYYYTFYLDYPPELHVSGEAYNSTTIVLNVTAIDNEDVVKVFVYVNKTLSFASGIPTNESQTIYVNVDGPGHYRIDVIAEDPFGLNSSYTLFINVSPPQENPGGESSGSSSSNNTASEAESRLSSLVNIVLLGIVLLILLRVFQVMTKD